MSVHTPDEKGSTEDAQDSTAAITGNVPALESTAPTEDYRFWLIIFALTLSDFLATLQLTSISIVLPTLAETFNASYLWIGAAFQLGASGFTAMTGGLSEVFGRRPVMLFSLFAFGFGSALSGCATSGTWLLCARVVQGIGAGGMQSLVEVIVSDLIPLKKRGLFVGLISCASVVASVSGPIIGGAFVRSSWRYLFYMNVPIASLAFVLIAIFLDLRSPKDDMGSKLRRMDWGGIFLILSSSTVVLLALTWGGVTCPWTSPQTMVPLILGLTGFVAFLVYEAKVAPQPIVPWVLINNPTSLGGYASAFITGMIIIMASWFFAMYLQSSKLESPLTSGVVLLAAAIVAIPSTILCGVSISTLHRYRPQNIVTWALSIVAAGVATMYSATSTLGFIIGVQLISGCAIGMAYSAPLFPVLAAVPITETANAMALFIFVRQFSQTWGMTLGSIILNNELSKRLPPSLRPSDPAAIIPTLAAMQPADQKQIRDAFASSIRVIWIASAGLNVVGLVAALFMKEIKMHEETDENWRLEVDSPNEAL